MKNLFLFIYLMLILSGVQAQAPYKFSYNAVVRDVSGNPLPNQTVAFQISILSGSTGGPVVYSETHLSTTDDMGAVTFVIGGGTVISGSMVTANWSGSSHFLKIAVDITGGTNYTDISNSQLVSVPYALYANQAGTIGGSPWTVSGNDIYNNNSGNVGVGDTGPVAKLSVKQDPGAMQTEPLFSVHDLTGMTVFAVYPDSVRIYVKDDGGTQTGAFAVCGRNTAKSYTSDFLLVSPDSTRLYGNNTSRNVAINRNVSSYPLHIGTNATNGNGAFLSPGGVWTNSSSREFKDRFTMINRQDVMNKISAMNIQGWYYKGTNEYHIGPVAEDFYQAFGCGSQIVPGDVNRYLAPSDVAGVSMLAVQGLIDEIKSEKQKNQILTYENTAMKTMIQDLKERVDAIENSTK